jgi:hypothetical protein
MRGIHFWLFQSLKREAASLAHSKLQGSSASI